VFIPKLIVCLREGYSFKQFRQDLGAGVVVGLVALPLAMAFAIASGLPPERGIYTAVVAGFLVSALGGSRVQIGGPTGAFVVIVAGVVATHGYQGLVLATIMAGFILLVMGFSQLGSMIKFIPYPVTTGFTSGIAVVIFSSQVRDFCGLRMASVPTDFLLKWKAFAAAAGTANPAALGIALGTVLLIWRWPASWQKVPRSLVALVLSSLAASLLKLPVETIGSRFGGIPHSLPAPTIPSWTWAEVKTLFPSATTIALLAAIESLLSAVVADGMIGTRHKSNMELVAQGIANILSPLFGGIPATGAIARTATNIRVGGRTPVAGIVHAFTLLMILVVAAPLASRIPLSALAGILVIVSYNMSEWRSFRFILTGPRSDIAVLLTTFLLTVFVDLTVAVEVGMVLAALLFMRNMAESTQVKSLSDSDKNGDHLRKLAIPKDVEVYSVEGSFFFGAAQKVMDISREIDQAPRVLILELSGVLHLDATGLHVLEKMRRECRQAKTRFVIAGIHTQPLVVSERSGFIKRLGEKNLYGDLKSALEACALS
jgi:SulP family sulfate permease